MAFVNEHISEKDKSKIDFASIGRTPHGDPKTDPVSPSIWTIDRDKDVFLMWTWSGRDDISNHQYFLYFWKGTPMHASMKYQFPAPNTVLWHLGWLNCPEHLRSEYDDMIRVLKEAFIVYEVFGDADGIIGHAEVQFDF